MQIRLLSVSCIFVIIFFLLIAKAESFLFTYQDNILYLQIEGLDGIKWSENESDNLTCTVIKKEENSTVQLQYTFIHIENSKGNIIPEVSDYLVKEDFIYNGISSFLILKYG